MNILVNERAQTIINEGKVHSKEIICLKCFENCKINIEDYKFNYLIIEMDMKQIIFYYPI